MKQNSNNKRGFATRLLENWISGNSFSSSEAPEGGALWPGAWHFCVAAACLWSQLIPIYSSRFYPNQKKCRARWSQCTFCQTFKELMPVFLKLICKIETWGAFYDHNHFMKLLLPSYQNRTNIQEKRKLYNNILYEHICKNLNKTLANYIQEHVKNFTQHNQEDFISEMQL